MLLATKRLLAFCGPFPVLAISAAVHIPNNSQSLFPSLNNISSTIQNSSLGSLLRLYPATAALDKEPSVECDAQRFGTPPSESCQEALSALTNALFSVGNPNLSFGPRDPAARGLFDVYLPERWIGCMVFSFFLFLVGVP